MSYVSICSHIHDIYSNIKSNYLLKVIRLNLLWGKKWTSVKLTNYPIKLEDNFAK